MLKYSILFVGFYTFGFGIQTALACGTAVGDMKPGDKVVGFEIKEAGMFGAKKNGTSKWAMDDDGIMILSVIASHCYADVPDAKVALTEAQVKCADDAQAGMKYDETMSFRPYGSRDFDKKPIARKAIQEKCGFDGVAAWNEAIEKVNELPLPCAEQVRRLTKKAVARNAEYNKEQSEPTYLNSLNLTPVQTREFIKNLTTDQAHGEKLVEMFSSTPVKTGDFTKWVDGLSSIVKRHGYQVVASPDEAFDPDKQQALLRILSDLGSPLPFAMRSRCGPAFPKDLVDRMSTMIWEPRGSEPGTQGGNKSKTGR